MGGSRYDVDAVITQQRQQLSLMHQDLGAMRRQVLMSRWEGLHFTRASISPDDLLTTYNICCELKRDTHVKCCHQLDDDDMQTVLVGHLHRPITGMCNLASASFP